MLINLLGNTSSHKKQWIPWRSHETMMAFQSAVFKFLSWGLRASFLKTDPKQWFWKDLLPLRNIKRCDWFISFCYWFILIYVNLYRIIFWQFRWRNLWYPNGPSPIVVPMFLHQTPKKWRWLDIPCLAKTIHCTSGNFQRGFSPPPSRCQIGWEIWRKPWWISTQNVFFQDFLLTITFNHMVKNEK